MTRASFLAFLAPAPPQPPVAASEVASTFRRDRIRVFVAVYLGYAFFYVVRKNIASALPSLMDDLHVSKASMGLVLSSFSVTYALAKLVNGPWCDRSNPRYFMAVGLGGAALANLLFGLSSSILVFGLFWVLNGFFQSMGSPVGPKTIANWFSSAERGRYYSLWNTCHNVGAFLVLLTGGFLVERWGWRSGFFFPACLAALGAVFVAWRMLDRPESVGLPSIQEYHGDVPKGTPQDSDETAVEVLGRYVLRNPRIWVVGIACMLVYMVRYGLGDWGVTYLRETRSSGLGFASLTSSFLELMGIPGTILAGVIADRYFAGRNLVVALIYSVGLSGSVLLVFYIPKGHPVWDAVAFGLSGFFIYGAQMVCTGLAPLELVPRRAVASAVGLTGAMSYLGAVLTSTLSGWITDTWGWRATFCFWAACGAAVVLALIPLVAIQRPPRRC